MRFLVFVLSSLLLLTQAYANENVDVTGQATVERPVDIYLHNPKTGKTEYMQLTLRSTNRGATFTLDDQSRKPVCTGGAAANPDNWVFQRLSCPASKLLIEEAVLVERFKFLVLRHALWKTNLNDGRTAGIFLHLGNESEYLSAARVSDEKLKELYGEFPNWNVPK